MLEGEALVGFMQLEPDLTLHRYSALARPTPASTWVDRAWVRERARAAALSDDSLAEPVLTYRESRDRLSWRIAVENRPATIWVAGDYVEVADVARS
jgi:hypothetical protein